MIKHRFNVPRHAIESTRREANSARFRESLRLREAAGYLQNDRRAMPEAPPALLLTGLEIDSNGAAVATLQTLATMEGKIVLALASRLDFDEYRFVLARDKYGAIQGMDFELSDLATRPAVRSALSRTFDDAADIAAALVDQPRQPIELPVRREKPEMVGEELIQRAAEMERQQNADIAAEKARRNVKPLGFTFD